MGVSWGSPGPVLKIVMGGEHLTAGDLAALGRFPRGSSWLSQELWHVEGILADPLRTNHGSGDLVRSEVRWSSPSRAHESW